MANRSILKGYFETKKKPTQGQFAALIDSLFHPGEDNLDMAKVAGLIAALALKADKTEVINVSRIVTINYGIAQYTVQAGTIVDSILIDAPTTMTLKCGLAADGEDVIATEQITGSLSFPIRLHCKTAQTLYFTGQISDTKIYIIKDKLV